MKIIINADDFGYSLDINDSIRSLMSVYKITSATIMVNAPAFKDAVRSVKEYPNCSFGVHLNLTKWQPIKHCTEFLDYGIADKDGMFVGNLHRVRPHPSLIKAVEKEWERQIQIAFDHGLPVSHLDSHHHTHTIPWLFLTLKRIQRRFGIRKVRITMNWCYAKKFLPSKTKSINKKIWNWALRHFYKTNVTDHFTSFQWFISNFKNSDRKQFNSIAELMCHPGQPWAVKETELLWSDWLEMLPFDVQLISYNDI